MADLQLDQISGEPIKTVTGNGEGRKKIPAHEAHLVHVVQGVPRHDPETGVDRGIYRPQTYTVQDFKTLKDAGTFRGQKVTILHDGGAPIEDIDPKDGDISKVVTKPGAGLPTAVDYTKMSAAQLKKVYAKLYPEDQNPPSKQADLLEAVQAKLTFMQDEAYRNETAGIDKNRLGPDAEAKEKEALKDATADVKQEAPAAQTPASTPPEETGTDDLFASGGTTAEGETP